VVSFTPRPFYSREKSPPYPLDRRLVDPRAGLDDVQKSRYADCAIPASTVSLWGGVKLERREDNHSPSSRTGVKNDRSVPPLPQSLYLVVDN
jgi:hypothetical protein